MAKPLACKNLLDYAANGNGPPTVGTSVVKPVGDANTAER
jgi:hypothetical protein